MGVSAGHALHSISPRLTETQLGQLPWQHRWNSISTDVFIGPLSLRTSQTAACIVEVMWGCASNEVTSTFHDYTISESSGTPSFKVCWGMSLEWKRLSDNVTWYSYINLPSHAFQMGNGQDYISLNPLLSLGASERCQDIYLCLRWDSDFIWGKSASESDSRVPVERGIERVSK